MLTAKDGEWDEVEALDTGADDYLTKPFSHAVLVARLRRCCAAGRRSGRSCSRPEICAWTRRPARVARRRRARPHRAGAGAARVPDAPARRGGLEDARSSPTCGTTTSRATRTSSRSTSATCATSSTAVRTRKRSRHPRRRLPARRRRRLSGPSHAAGRASATTATSIRCGRRPWQSSWSASRSSSAPLRW